MAKEPAIYGIAAEFTSPEALLEAAYKVHAEGYRRADAFSSFPVHGLAEALGYPRSNVPLLTLIGGVFGALLGYFMCWYANVVSYRWNVGGRPPNSWEAFIPITFEVGVLCASLVSVFGMFILNGLPMPYHPMFNISSFDLASRDRFFLVIESGDQKFDPSATRAFLTTLNAVAVTEVPT